MTEETEVVTQIAEQSAPVPETTAAPDTELSTPEAPKTFTQEELDAIVSKRLAREQRKWEREQARKASDAHAPAAPVEPPKPDQYESTEAYAEALATQKAAKLIQQREIEREQAELVEAYSAREEEARNKYDDFEQVVYNASLPITAVMAQSIQASELGPDVAYYLGTNPKEADRISKLPALQQAKEIGKIEVKLTTSPPVRKTSSAPEPISPVKARASSAPVVDTTDPRSIKSMSTSEWIEAERQRQIRKWEAQNRR